MAWVLLPFLLEVSAPLGVGGDMHSNRVEKGHTMAGHGRTSALPKADSPLGRYFADLAKPAKGDKTAGAQDSSPPKPKKPTSVENNEETRKLQQRLAAMYGGGLGEIGGLSLSSSPTIPRKADIKPAKGEPRTLAGIFDKHLHGIPRDRATGDLKPDRHPSAVAYTPKAVDPRLARATAAIASDRQTKYKMPLADGVKPLMPVGKGAAREARLAATASRGHKVPSETFTFAPDRLPSATAFSTRRTDGKTATRDSYGWFVDGDELTDPAKAPASAPRTDKPRTFKADNGRTYQWGDPMALFDGAVVPWGNR